MRDPITGELIISPVPAADIRTRLTRLTSFQAYTASGTIKEVYHPTKWLVEAMMASGDWTGWRYCEGKSDNPVLRPDGTVWQEQGWDRVTRVIFDSTTTFPRIPDLITREMAVAAAEEVLEVVVNFPFEAPHHRSGYLSAVLDLPPFPVPG
jgi:hypothetical protein